MGKKRERLTLRTLPDAGGYDTPHVQTLRGARYVLFDLRRLTAAAHERAAAAGGGPDALAIASLQDALERQALSEAVQVLSAMACEGAINLFGMLLVGEDEFYSKAERWRSDVKVSELVLLARGEPLQDNDRLLLIIRRLQSARNAFVHPKPKEGERAVHYEFPPDLESAEAAFTLASEFIVLLGAVNTRYSGMLSIW